MALTRRNTIIGLGALVTGAGAITASGAFTTVQAERSVDIQITGDSNAQLILDVRSEEFTGLSDDDDGTIQLQAEALNQDAITRFQAALEVQPTGDESQSPWTLDIFPSFDDAATNSNSLTRQTINGAPDAPRLQLIPNANHPNWTNNAPGGSDDYSLDKTSNGKAVAGKNDVVVYDIVVNLRDDENSDVQGTETQSVGGIPDNIVIEAQSNNQTTPSS